MPILKIFMMNFAIFASAFLVLNAAGCADSQGDLKEITHQNEVLTNANEGSSPNRLTIAKVEAEVRKFASTAHKPGPNLVGSFDDINKDDLFGRTQTGSYINDLSSMGNNKSKIDRVSGKVLDYISSTGECHKDCSDEFKKMFKYQRNELRARLSQVATQAIANEIPNASNFVTYYSGFPNEFRLYQDVLRALKSFEMLKPLNNTYMFRDFSFDDKKVNMKEFLLGWWPAYLKHARELKKPAFPTRGVESPGESSGLTFFPDSIQYARDYLISANLSLFGNIISPKNNSLFFFLNSSSATQLDIVNPLIKKSLSPYIRLPNGEEDTAKLERVLKELNGIFDQHMSKSGGQLAQIFLHDDYASYTSYVAWNGGHPVWFSKDTNRTVFAHSGKTNKIVWRPKNVFWPSGDNINKLYLPNIDKFVGTYIRNPARLAHFFPVNSIIKTKLGANFLKVGRDSQENKRFLSRDVLQARILPHPQYFSNPSIAGVKLYTMNEVSKKDLQDYEAEVFTIVRDVISDFLATAKETDFKPGKYGLKSLFLEQ